MIRDKGPFISIVTPVYNTASLLPRCIDSVLSQSYSNWELLLVNDGSQDNSLELCQSYAQQDERIHWFSQHNQGQSVARNLALDNAKGDVVVFLDSDDALAQDTLLGVSDAFAERPDCDVVVISIRWSNPQEVFWTHWTVEDISAGEIARREMVKGKYKHLLCNKAYRREVLEGIRFYPGILFEDNLLLFELVKRIRAVGVSRLGGYEYHQEEYDPNKNNWTGKKDRDQITVYLKTLDLYKDGESSFNSFVRRYIYGNLTNYLFPRIMRWQVEGHLHQAQTYLANISWRDIWEEVTSDESDTKIKTRVWIASKWLIVKVWSWVYIQKQKIHL